MSAWTEARIEALKLLWPANELSCSQIALELSNIDSHAGPVSRNAVIGKKERLGLADRKARNSPVRVSAARRASRVRHRQRCGQLASPPRVAESSPPPPPPPIDDTDIPTGQRRALSELGGGICRWPVGDPLTPDFFFCGAVCPDDQPYCTGHMRRAYQPASSLDGRAFDRAAKWLGRFA